MMNKSDVETFNYQLGNTGRYYVGASPSYAHVLYRPTYWLTDAFWLPATNLLDHGAYL